MNPQFIQEIIIDWAQIAPRSYLHTIDSLAKTDRLRFTKPITFFVGENGSGKSTLLEAIAIACGFNPEGGTRNYHFSTKDSHSKLFEAIKISRGYRKERWGYFLRAESFYNVATKEQDYAEVLQRSERYHEKSHGEAFLALLQKQIQSDGIYFLDEPEAALSPQRQLTLLAELFRHGKRGAQFLIATHSPILLGLPGAEILAFDCDGIHPCAYEETESYQVMKLFIEHRAQLLRELLSEETE